MKLGINEGNMLCKLFVLFRFQSLRVNVKGQTDREIKLQVFYSKLMFTRVFYQEYSDTDQLKRPLM